jgi:hypothetical protein
MDPPAPPLCLTRAYSASADQKGGTLIAEDVVDMGNHRKMLADPDAYRPAVCACGCTTLDAHDFRDRKLGGESVSFRRYRCRRCLAVWLVLAAFVARCLHQRWDRIEGAVEGKIAVPRRTFGRWLKRLRSSALLLVQLLAEATTLPLDMSWSRGELVQALKGSDTLGTERALALLAAWIHRLRPGLRLI